MSRQLALFLFVVTALRLAAAAAMPLSADEAYYRIWAHALAPGYLDHPPMVALWIRAGIALAGDTPFGIRLLSPFTALLGSLLLLKAGNDLSPGRGDRAVYLLNATLLLNAGAITATPDTPLLLFWTATLTSLIRLIRTQNQIWWLFTALSAGLACDSKYTAALLAPAILAWLPFTPYRKTWPPYAAALLSLTLTTPILYWNATHHWASFLRQGLRTTDWHPAAALSHLAELAAGQAALATPLIFLLFLIARPKTPILIATTAIPALVFLEHALGDRVQANWPAILYPGAALAAAQTRLPIRRAVALGLTLSALITLQATLSPFPLPRRLDPTLIRLAGWQALTDSVESAANGACLAADDYALASELAFHATIPVLGTESRWALFNLPPAPPTCHDILLVRSARRTALPSPIGTATRARGGITAETYFFYRMPVPPTAVSLPLSVPLSRAP